MKKGFTKNVCNLHKPNNSDVNFTWWLQILCNLVTGSILLFSQNVLSASLSPQTTLSPDF